MIRWVVPPPPDVTLMAPVVAGVARPSATTARLARIWFGPSQLIDEKGAFGSSVASAEYARWKPLPSVASRVRLSRTAVAPAGRLLAAPPSRLVTSTWTVKLLATL